MQSYLWNRETASRGTDSDAAVVCPKGIHCLLSPVPFSRAFLAVHRLVHCHKKWVSSVAPPHVGHLSSTVANAAGQGEDSGFSARSGTSGQPAFPWQSSVPITLGAGAVRVAVAEEINSSLCLNVSQTGNCF